jgi:hypothetical protein
MSSESTVKQKLRLSIFVTAESATDLPRRGAWSNAATRIFWSQIELKEK